MFDARWFPYAGWIADFKIVDAMLKILDTSRASKNRINRINKLIFSYYDKKEINNIKREWRQMSIPSYMTRILVQSVQAYHRREFALTVSALSTLWEGIIQEKTNDTSYRISRKTRDNLTKLIEENEFDKIFSSFCEEFIFTTVLNLKMSNWMCLVAMVLLIVGIMPIRVERWHSMRFCLQIFIETKTIRENRGRNKWIN